MGRRGDGWYDVCELWNPTNVFGGLGVGGCRLIRWLHGLGVGGVG